MPISAISGNGLAVVGSAGVFSSTTSYVTTEAVSSVTSAISLDVRFRKAIDRQVNADLLTPRKIRRANLLVADEHARVRLRVHREGVIGGGQIQRDRATARLTHDGAHLRVQTVVDSDDLLACAFQIRKTLRRLRRRLEVGARKLRGGCLGRREGGLQRAERKSQDQEFQLFHVCALELMDRWRGTSTNALGSKATCLLTPPPGRPSTIYLPIIEWNSICSATLIRRRVRRFLHRAPPR